MASELSFGERLADLRTAKKITQGALGDIVGVNQKTVSNYETNDIFPSMNVLIRLSDYFNVSLDYLVARTDFDLRKDNLEQTYIVYKGKKVSVGNFVDLLSSLDNESRLEIYELVYALIKGGKLKLSASESID